MSQAMIGMIDTTLALYRHYNEKPIFAKSQCLHRGLRIFHTYIRSMCVKSPCGINGQLTYSIR